MAVFGGLSEIFYIFTSSSSSSAGIKFTQVAILGLFDVLR